MKKEVAKITVAGAGLAGTLMSIFLAKRGFQVDLYETRPDLRKNVLPAGRSINMAMSERGIHALQTIGIFDQIRDELIPMKGRMIHATDSSIYFQPYGTRPNEFNYSISRSKLNELLLDAAEEYKNLTVHFNHKCVDYDFKQKTALFIQQDENKKEVKISAPVIIGADGAFSHVRKSMLRLSRFNYSQEYLDWGYKELSIPPGPDGKHLIDVNALHIWPRGRFMLIALPNTDGSFTCTLFLPYEGSESFEELSEVEEVRAFFEKYFPDAVKLMPNLLEDYEKNPVGSMINIECSPWNYKGNAVLLGDAAHSMTPFFGQGMNASFEDCYLLDQAIAETPDDLEVAFAEFAAKRKIDTDAICQMSRENFVEMRDNVGVEAFKLKKQMEHDLEFMYPELFRSRYSRVSFSREPYSQVYEQGTKNEEILRKVLEFGKNIEDIDPYVIKKILTE